MEAKDLWLKDVASGDETGVVVKVEKGRRRKWALGWENVSLHREGTPADVRIRRSFQCRLFIWGRHEGLDGRIGSFKSGGRGRPIGCVNIG